MDITFSAAMRNRLIARRNLTVDIPLSDQFTCGDDLKRVLVNEIEIAVAAVRQKSIL